jgi:hypothetical protein
VFFSYYINYDEQSLDLFDLFSLFIDNALPEQLRPDAEGFNSENLGHVPDNADGKVDVVENEECQHSIDEQPLGNDMNSQDEVRQNVERIARAEHKVGCCELVIGLLSGDAQLHVGGVPHVHEPDRKHQLVVVPVHLPPVS